MRVVSKKFLSSAAAIAMIVAAPTAAFAFDEVNWIWDKQINEQVDIDIDIIAELTPRGLTEIEKLQIQIGDVEASSVVYDIENNQPTYDGDIASVESAATAVGNNQSITSDVGTYLHDGQFLFDQGDLAKDEGGIEDVVGGLVALGLGSQFADNSHTALAVGTSVLAITGTIDKVDVDATSEVYDILNARVDSSATAVGNNIAVNVNPDGSPGESILLADMTQFSLADISASSSVYDVEVNNYTNVALADPLVSSVATAVGNNVSINVGDVGN